MAPPAASLSSRPGVAMQDCLTREKERERQRADRERQEKEHERRWADRERQEKEELLARAIRLIHGLGQSAEEIARTLSVDAEEVRRVLSA